MAAASAQQGKQLLQKIHDDVKNMIDEFNNINKKDQSHEANGKAAIVLNIAECIKQYNNQKIHDSGVKSYEDKHKAIMKLGEELVAKFESQ